MLESIVLAFPDLNAEWLLRGYGSTWKKIEENSGNLIQEPPPQYEIKKEVQEKAKPLPSDIDIDILKKAVELLQIEMWKLKSEMEELKKKK